jgi:dihydroorotase
MFDLLVKNGTVIDPGSGNSGRLDVAVLRGRIEVVDSDIPETSSAIVLDATDRLVTPGLVDLHSHVYARATAYGLDPDPIAAVTGVTTWIDGGSAGAFGIDGLREYVATRAKVRVRAFINISCIGLIAHNHELANLEYCSSDLAVAAARNQGGFVVGVKYRAGRAGSAADLEPLKRAKRASERLEMPLMVHLSLRPPTVDDVVAHLGAGDILTHTYTNNDMKIIDENDVLLDSVRQARDSGVVIDIGHGEGSFSWETGEVLAAAGFWPDTISTDIHLKSIRGHHKRGYLADGTSRVPPFEMDSDAGGVVFTYEEGSGHSFDLLDCMAKLLHLGMPLDEVVRAVTHTPARVIGLDKEFGSLRPGMQADIAILKVNEGRFELFDVRKKMRTANRSLSCDATIVAGKVLPRSADILPLVPWVQPVMAGHETDQ